MDYTFHFGEVLRYWPLLVTGLVNTLLFSVVAMAGGAALGMVGAVARNARNPVLRAAAAFYVELIRNTPLLVQLFVAFFVLPSLGLRLTATQAALLALVLNNGAYMTEIVRAGLESIHNSQREAAVSLGLTTFQTFCWVTILQALDKVYPAILSQFILLMLSSSIISAIGADELTAFGSRIQSDTFRPLEVYLICALLYLGVTYLVRGALQGLALVLFPRRLALRRS